MTPYPIPLPPSNPDKSTDPDSDSANTYQLLPDPDHDLPPPLPSSPHLLKRDHSSPPMLGLTPRYTTVSIPASYGRLASSPPPGTVAGIVLGSVFGFIFVLYLLYMMVFGRRLLGRSSVDEEMSVSGHSSSVTSESVSVGFARPSRSQRRPRPRMRPGPRMRGPRGNVVEVIEEEGPGPGRRPRPVWSRRPAGRRGRGDVVVEESGSASGSGRSEGDMVEVIEEHSSVDAPPSSPRRSGRYGRRNRSGGYRREEADPLAYGGESSLASSRS